MDIPDYQTLMLPALEVVSQDGVVSIGKIRERVARRYKLTDAQLGELLPSGKQPVFSNRVGWALVYMKKAGLLNRPGRGSYEITQTGREVLSQSPEAIGVKFLSQFKSFQEFINPQNRTKEAAEFSDADDSRTPLELLEQAHKSLRDSLIDDLLEHVKSCTPFFFEKLVVEVLVAMGYGGSVDDVGLGTNRGSDGGIDGIIKQDPLGLDIICVQAKRWENTVGRPAIQAFAGSMEGHRARKGVIFTTSEFSAEAREYVRQIERKIILVDGRSLCSLMVEHSVGVATSKVYELKRLDTDYFSDDM